MEVDKYGNPVTSSGDIYGNMIVSGADTKFVDWMRTNKINPTNLNAEQMAGLERQFKGDTGGLFGTNITGTDALDTGLGLGQLGLGVASYLDQIKTSDIQRNLMNQQKEQNKFLIDQAKGRQADISKAFGSGGLAAQSL